MKPATKLVYSLFFVFVLLIIYHISLISTHAQIPPPTIPCGETSEPGPEFAHLRPYQASPCGSFSKTYFCGNRIIIYEEVQDSWEGGPEICSNDHKDVKEKINKTYIINMKDLELPILGNTELTRNSTNTDDTIDDAEKLNEYVSWYLSGANNKAEYPPLSGEDEEDIRKIIDFSGPIQKLLSQESLTRQRIKSIEQTSEYVTTTEDIRDGSVIKPLESTDIERHNQIVGCTLFGIPIPCYGIFGGSEHRLKDWETHLPPLREDYDNFSDYNIAYRRWRGESCARLPIPIIDKEILFCFNNPFVPDYWSTLFANIPLSSTEDSKSKAIIQGVGIKPLKDTVINPERPSYEVLDEVALYYPHAQEDLQLSELLNSSYIPQVGTDNQIDYETVESDTDPETNTCRLIDVRTNPGDDLFAEVDPNSYDVDVEEYTIKTIPCNGSCDCETIEEEDDPNTPQIESGFFEYCTKGCSGGTVIEIRTITKVPNAQEIFQSTTAGTSSTFRRLFPKVEEGAPVECIANIPTVTKAQYEGFSMDSKSYTKNTKNASPKDIIVEEPNENRTDGIDANLYFPYFGSVYEYFLKGIQTALRPKGYGEPITQGVCEPSELFGDVCEVADAYGIPCCQLEGVMELETKSGTNMGSGGPFGCCSGNVCGPAQIMAGDYESLDAGDGLDICSNIGAAELLSRIMLLKLCQANGQCNAYDWAKFGEMVQKNYKIPDGDYTATAYFYGLNNGCSVSACSQYRWGEGNGYCDSVENFCKTGAVLPDNTSMQFCEGCNEELVRAGQTPIDCSQ